MCPVNHTFLLHCFNFPHCWSAFYRSAGYDVIAVKCGMTAVTWFDASTNQRQSAFSIPHFTFCIPHSTVPHFTHYRSFRPNGIVVRVRDVFWRCFGLTCEPL